MASKKQIEELKDILLMREVEIKSNIIDGMDNISKLQDNDCKDNLDFAETSSDSFTSTLIVQQQQRELEEINNALESINSKTYGICDMCDEPISIGRLKAKPFAKYCTDCRKIHEHK